MRINKENGDTPGMATLTKCRALYSLPFAFFLAFFIVLLGGGAPFKSVGPVETKVPAIRSSSRQNSSEVFYPLVLGDPTLKPIQLLEENFVYQEKNCGTFNHGDFFLCKIEWDIWILVEAFVQPGDVVMEFGGRFGTTSCHLSRAVGRTGAVVAVEPDESVHGYLLQNRYLHNCGFHALLGTVGAPQYRPVGGQGDYAQEMTTEKPYKNAVAFANMELSEVEKAIGQKVNVAVIDCEGCIGSVHAAGVLDQVDVIILEEDGSSRNLDEFYRGEWHKKLVGMGFSCKWYTQDTYDPNAEWSRGLKYSVWIREGSMRKQQKTCKQFAKETKTDRSGALVCLDIPSSGLQQ